MKINEKAGFYSNNIGDVIVASGETSYGKVLVDFQPSKGFFLDSETTSAGQQLQALSTKMLGDIYFFSKYVANVIIITNPPTKWLR